MLASSRSPTAMTISDEGHRRCSSDRLVDDGHPPDAVDGRRDVDRRQGVAAVTSVQVLSSLHVAERDALEDLLHLGVRQPPTAADLDVDAVHPPVAEPVDAAKPGRRLLVGVRRRHHEDLEAAGRVRAVHAAVRLAQPGGRQRRLAEQHARVVAVAGGRDAVQPGHRVHRASFSRYPAGT